MHLFVFAGLYLLEFETASELYETKFVSRGNRAQWGPKYPVYPFLFQVLC